MMVLEVEKRLHETPPENSSLKLAVEPAEAPLHRGCDQRRLPERRRDRDPLLEPLQRRQGAALLLRPGRR